MASTDLTKEVEFDLSPLFKIYKDGTIERLLFTDSVPPSSDDRTRVSSKDVIVSADTGVSARLYLPKLRKPDAKLPLVVYFHGGGFCIASATASIYHSYLNHLSAQAHVLIVSVDFRRPTEHPLPIAYDDSWAVLNWALAHGDGEPWLSGHADLGRVFLCGDSAGANIAHNMGMRAGYMGLDGLVLIHPYFWGSEPIGSEESADPRRKSIMDRLWRIVNPGSTGHDDPLINPVGPGAPSLAGLGCARVMVCVAGKDILKDRGQLYYESVLKSGFEGKVEMVETEGEEHCFHLFDYDCDNSVELMKRLVSFIGEA